MKTERNALFLCVCLVCGNRPSYASAECPHYAPRGACTQRPPLCVTVSVCVSDRVCVHLSSDLSLRWRRELACALVWATTDASPLLSLIERGRQNGAKRQERNVSGNGRKRGTDRERQSEGVEEKHEVIGGTFTSAGSLTSLSLSFLSLVSHSFCASLIPSLVVFVTP